MLTAIEGFSELIGLIYDCAIDPAAWQGALEAIRRRLGYHNAVLAVHSVPSAASVLSVVTGPAPEYIAAMPRYWGEVVELWGGAEQLGRFPLEEPVVGSKTFKPGALQASLYYREWCEPQGVFDAVALPLVRDSSTLGSVAMGRHVSAGDVKELDLIPLRLVAPHLRRAVSINRLINLQSIRTGNFATTLDGLDTAIVFVDVRMKVDYANPAASDLIRTGDLMRLHQGALQLVDEGASDELAAAVALAVRNEAKLGRRGIGIPARRREGEPSVIHVLPLGGDASRAALMGKAAAALFVTPSRAAPEVPADALARLYDLTPTEARIMQFIADGFTLVETAEHVRIALSTVRSHLKQIYAKTGCQRQADIVTFANAFRRPG